MKLHHVLALLLVFAIIPQVAWSQTFQPTSGTPVWNDNNNWGPSPPQPFPNVAGATAILQAPTTPSLTVDLGTSITVGTLNVNKDSAGFATTVGVGTANTLTFDGTGSILNNGNSATAAGTTTIAAPIVFGPTMASSTFTIKQAGPSTLQLTGGMSGSGNLLVTRDTNGTGAVILGAANSYTGTVTTLSNSQTGTNYLLVRLGDVNSIPGGIGTTGGTSNILATNSVIFGLSASNFTRGIGTSLDQLSQFNGSGNQGWAAFGFDRAVNLFGDGRKIIWGNSGAFFGNLTLGHASADKTIDFQNILDLNTGGGAVNRNIRIEDGTAAIDAIISGNIVVGSGSGVLTFQAGGTVSLKGDNSTITTYTTAMSNATTVILDKAPALPGTNLSMTGNSILGLGNENDSFTRALGTTGSTVQFTGGGGFAAFGGNKTVNLGGAAATVTWGSGNFVTSGNNLTLSSLNASGTLDFKNPINVNNVAARIIDVPDGSAAIDAILSGGVSDTGTLGSIRKNSDGTLQLITANSYNGQTIVAGGSLRLDIAGALPSTSPLNLQGGGVIGLGIGNDEFTRTLGSSAGQVSTSGTGGGFAAYGGTKVVRLNNDANYTVVWGTTNLFNSTQLILSDGGADGTVDFQNKIDLNGSVRTIQGRGGSALIDAKLSGVISGAGLSGILKNNPGTVELSAANTYAGTTQVSAGVLLLTNASSIPGGITGGNTGNIIFGGTNASNIGVIGLGQGNFTSGLGTGAGQVDMGTNAAFAAFYANRVVNLGGASAQVTWRNSLSDPGNFVVNVLRLGDVGADATVDFQNPINLNGAERTVSAANGTATIMGVLSGEISGSGLSKLTKDGGGSLSLTGANTYAGGTKIIQGRLLVNNTSGSGVGSGDVSVTAGTLGGSGLIGTISDASNVSISSGAHLAPGNSAGKLTVFGDVSLPTGALLDIEIGGLVAGTDYDQLELSGTATLGGTLNVTLINSFPPQAGNTFDILNGTLSGTFAAVNLPTLTGNLQWDQSQLYTTGVLSVVSTAVAGDWNGDTKVNAADYVTWRKDETGFGGAEGANPSGYVTWRENFSQTSGAAAGLSSQAVPEPATFLLLLAVIPLVATRREPRIRR